MLEKGRHELSASLIRKSFISRLSLKHNLSTDSLMAYSPTVNCRRGTFIKSRKKSYHLNSFKRLTKTTIFS